MIDREYRIPFNKPYIVGKELTYIADAVNRNKHLAGDGPFTRKCEKWLENALGCHRALLTPSCTASLECVALLCDLKPGDEVIMPSFTFVSTANAFALRGAVPVFVDIRPDTLNIDETLIAQAVSPRTKGIVVVHYAGTPCAMDEILDIGESFNLWIAEDAAHALLSKYRGRFLGTLGQFGCLSFHETKNIISGEGGALLLNSERLVKQAEIIRDKGTNRRQFFEGHVDKYSWVDLGSSFLTSDIVAAFLYAQLENAHRIVDARCKTIHAYHRLLEPLQDEGFLKLPHRDAVSTCNGHLYFVLTRSADERSRLIRYLGRHGILAVFHYVPLHSSPGGRKYGRTAGPMPVTDDLSSRVLRLPVYYGITDEEVCEVAAGVKRFFHEYLR